MLAARRILVAIVVSGVGVACGESRDVSRQEGTVEAIVAPALADTAVDVVPRWESGPNIVYPDSLRESGVEGRVVVAGVVETDGSIDPDCVLDPRRADDLASGDAAFQQVDDGPARCLGRAKAVRVRSRDGGGSWQAHTHRFCDAAHRVGRAQEGAGPASGRGTVLQLQILFFGDSAGL